MKMGVTVYQKAEIMKAMVLFLDAIRNYIENIMQQRYGTEHWSEKYTLSLTPEQKIIWNKGLANNQSPHDLIDYAHLFQFFLNNKELIRESFQEDVRQLPTRFAQIKEFRNHFAHFEPKIERDDLNSFWINTRAIARGIRNTELLDELVAIEKEFSTKKTEDPAREILNEKEVDKQNGPGFEIPNAKYFLPILVRGQKAHMVHLCGNDKPNNVFVRSFIFEQNADQIHLFSLIGGAFQGRTTADRNQTCRIVSLKNQSGNLIVEIESVDVLTDLPVKAPENLKVEYDAEFQHQKVFSSIDSNFKNIIFRLKTNRKSIVHEEFKEGENVFTGSIKTAFAPAEQIYDLAMDFGSEASQVVVSQRSIRGHINRKKLVSLMKDTFFPALQGALHQEDPDDELFRSQIFVLKQGVIMDKSSHPNKHQGADIISTLTEKEKIDQLKNTHFLIPNPKLAHLGIYNFKIGYKDRNSNPYFASEKEFGSILADVQQTIINHILHALLHSMHKQKNDKELLFINIKFLVPNVLEQSRLTRLINEAYRFFDQQEIKKTYNIGGVEVTTLSESDASFLGYWSKPGIPKVNGTYVIVDVGKGTTDFSIIKSDGKFNLSSQYRSGFIGAGNVITYAFIETIVAAVLGGDTAAWAERKKLLKIIASTQTDIASKYSFIELVEGLKRNFQKEGTVLKPLKEIISSQIIEDIRKSVTDRTANSTLLSIIVQVMEKVVENQGSIRDDFGFINNAVQKLVRKLINQIVVSDVETVGKNLEKLDKIVLTGRGYLFEKLVDEMRQQIKGDKSRIVVQNQNDQMQNELKKICLSGAFSGRIINHDVNLVGIPHLHTLTNVATPGGMETFTRFNKGKNDSPVRIKSDSLAEKLMVYFGDSAFYDDTEEVVKPDLSKTAALETQLSILDFFTRGTIFKDPYNTNIHSVHISGIRYLCEGLGPNEKIDIFFDGEQFWLRTHNGLRSVTYPREFIRNDSMVWQTLFPFFDAVADYHTPIDNSLADINDEI